MNPNNKDQLTEFFNTHQNQFDVEDLPSGHELRFLQKMNRKKSSKKSILYKIVGLAAVFVIGFLIFQNTQNSQNHQEKNEVVISKQTQETTQYFEYLLASELNKLQKYKDPISQKVIQDALLELEKLELDYQKIEIEWKKNGESKQLIHAMILNFQTRISFLENVLQQIEIINNQKNNQNENNLL
jgi:hypothetical protein